MNLIQFVITGKLLWEDETYYHTTEGEFNKHIYRKPIEVVEDGFNERYSTNVTNC